MTDTDFELQDEQLAPQGAWQRKIKHSALSKKSLRIKVLDENRTTIMVATGFLFAPESRYPEFPTDLNELVLVTNFHVVFNHSIDDIWLSMFDKKYPRFLRVYLPEPIDVDPLGADPEDDEDQLLSIQHFDVDLYVGDAQALSEKRREWYSEYWHIEGQKKARNLLGPRHVGDYPTKLSSDIAVIPVPREVTQQLSLSDRAYVWDERFLELNDAQYALEPTQVVQVVGYPLSAKEFTVNMPVWTGGAVANEVNSGPTDRFLIDARTRPGQSGSPVILYRPETQVRGALSYIVPEKGMLLGVYSGRTSDQDDLGFVWWGREIARLYNSLPRSAWSRSAVSIRADRQLAASGASDSESVPAIPDLAHAATEYDQTPLAPGLSLPQHVTDCIE